MSAEFIKRILRANVFGLPRRVKHWTDDIWPEVETHSDRFFETLPDGRVDEAPARLRVKGQSFFTTETYLRQGHRADWAGVSPDIAAFASRLVLTLRKQRVPMFVHSAARSPSEQMRLLRAGRSRSTPEKGYHCHGAAVDVIHSHFAWSMTDMEWLYIGTVGKRIAASMKLHVEWGGDWGADWARGKRGWDPAHWQLKDGLSRPMLASGGPPLRLTPHALKERYKGLY